MNEEELVETVEEVIEILPEDLDEFEAPEDEPVLPAAEEIATSLG